LVVLVRPTDVATDSRAKKMAISIERLGHDVVVLGRSSTAARREGRIGGARVLVVPPRSRLRGTPRRLLRLPAGRLRRVETFTNARAQRLERDLDRRLRERDRRRGGAYLFRAAQRDFWTTYGTELVRLAPDVVHVHDPRLLPTAFRAAERVERTTGRRVSVVYDARENFAGVSETQATLPRYHDAVVETERTYGARCAALVTVSPDVADALAERVRAPVPPVVVLNAPPLVTAPDPEAVRHLRSDAGVDDDATVLVYPGAASRARGVDTVVEALPALPGVHFVIVAVPYPHPREDEMRTRARELGVDDRLHLVPPVQSDDVPRYLSEADVAIHPMLSGIPNHDMALPNKLFEIMHARLPMASSSARRMAAFVTEHSMGEVFTAADPEDLARVVADLVARRRAGTAPVASEDDIRRYSWQGQEDALAAAYARATRPAAAHVEDPYPPVHVVWDDGA
jgi:glycosyltransferase involved in cell wall biosynthesis